MSPPGLLRLSPAEAAVLISQINKPMVVVSEPPKVISNHWRWYTPVLLLNQGFFEPWINNQSNQPNITSYRRHSITILKPLVTSQSLFNRHPTTIQPLFNHQKVMCWSFGSSKMGEELTTPGALRWRSSTLGHH